MTQTRPKIIKQEIINLSNKLKIDYYLKNTKEYQKDKEIINSISKFISESIEGVLTINERSYQIFKNEKHIFGKKIKKRWL